MPNDDQFDDQPDDQNNSNWRRELEAKARRADELAAENETLKKDIVFTTALTGIDHPGLSYFKDGYKGDLTPEAIRQAAVEAGFGRSEPETPQTDQQQQSPAQPADLAASQRMAAAQAGSAPPPPFDPIEAMSKANSKEEVMEIVRAHGEKYGFIASDLAQ